MRNRPLLFYGWFIVVIAITGGPIIYGIRNSFSVFFPRILDEFGWQRGDTAIMLSVNILVYGLLASVIGGLADRWKPRKVTTIGIVVLSLATASCAFATELWHFYLLYGILVPVGIGCCGVPLVQPSLVYWFAIKRGLVIGLSQVGAGLSFVYSILVEFIIDQVGWRHAYLALAGIDLAVLLPLYLLFFYYRPEDKGLKAYGWDRVTNAGSTTEKVKAADYPVSGDWTLGKAMKTYQLWAMVLTHFLYFGVANYLVLAHQVRFAQDAGYSSIFAASIFALAGSLMIAGQLCGFVSDKIGREKVITLATALEIGSLFALMAVRDISQPWLLYVYAICFGFGAGLYMPSFFASMADLFYGRHFGSLSGLLLGGLGIGGAIGPWLGGYIYDTSGSYISAFILCMICLGLACTLVWIAAPRHAAAFRTRLKIL